MTNTRRRGLPTASRVPLGRGLPASSNLMPGSPAAKKAAHDVSNQVGAAHQADAAERAGRQLRHAMRHGRGEQPRPWSRAIPSLVKNIADGYPKLALQGRARTRIMKRDGEGGEEIQGLHVIEEDVVRERRPAFRKYSRNDAQLPRALFKRRFASKLRAPDDGRGHD